MLEAVRRRPFLLAASSVLAGLFEPRWISAATPPSDLLEQRDLRFDQDRRLARRALLLLPRERPRDKRLPLLVLLHGLGETVDEDLGIHAWGERYGLVSSYERLSRPPVVRTLEKARYLTDDHLATVNRTLRQRPFSGMALLCPFTPNVYKLPPTGKTLDRYADWLESVLLPAVRKEAPVSDRCELTALDGCSLGGYVGLEVFLRKPHLFGSWGGVQSAIGPGAAPRYAERLAEAAADTNRAAIRLGTSTGDPYRKANESLSAALGKLGVTHTLEVHPGPHNQPWLREVGTLSMLLWHDRVWARRLSLRAGSGGPAGSER